MDPRTAMEAELRALEAEGKAAGGSRRPVTLDQQAVGRLSRMDALQNQAMALGQQRRREARTRALHAALARLDADEWGYCDDCGERIEPRRLSLDPAIALCLDCMRG